MIRGPKWKLVACEGKMKSGFREIRFEFSIERSMADKLPFTPFRFAYERSFRRDEEGHARFANVSNSVHNATRILIFRGISQAACCDMQRITTGYSNNICQFDWINVNPTTFKSSDAREITG